MKIRNDFVTNSSSSSFIIAYNDESKLLSDLHKFAKENENVWDLSQYQAVVFDILKNRLSYDEAISKVRQFAKDDCWIKFAINIPSKYKNQSEWVRTQEYNDLCTKYIDSVEADFRNKFNSDSWISLLEYSDSDGFYDIRKNLGKMIDGVVMSVNE